MISTSGIFCTGEKKCTPTKFSGLSQASASEVIGSVEVLEAKIASGPEHGLRLAGGLGLDGAILEHGLDDEIAARQRRVVRRRRRCGRAARRGRPSWRGPC